MRTKTSLAAIAMVGLVAAPVLESRQISQTESRNADLSTQNADLQAQINRLGNRLRKIKSLMADPVLKASANPNDYLPVSKEIIAGLSFGPAPDLKLDSNTIGLLAMTPAEAGQVQDIYNSLKNRIDAHQRATVRAVSADETSVGIALGFMQRAHYGNSGKLSFFEIPPMNPDEVEAQRPLLADSLAKALGEERGGILFQKMLESILWLAPNTTEIYRFEYPNDDSGLSEIQKANGPKSLGEYIIYHGQDAAQVVVLSDGNNEDNAAFVKALYNSGRDKAEVLPNHGMGQTNNTQATP